MSVGPRGLCTALAVPHPAMIDDPVFAVETLTLGLEGGRLHRVLWLRDKAYDRRRLRCDPELWLVLGRGFGLMVDGRTGRSGGAPTGEMRDPMALKPTGDQTLALYAGIVGRLPRHLGQATMTITHN